MQTLQSELQRLDLGAVFGPVDMRAVREDSRYEVPEFMLASIYGLGCTCWRSDMTVPNPSAGYRFGECTCVARSTAEQSGSFVAIFDIRASVQAEVGVYSMTPAEYEAWFTESERAEYDATPAYKIVKSHSAPDVDYGYMELDEEEYDAYMQEVA